MSDLIDLLPDLFYGLGSIRTKRMFGGHGVYADDVFFAWVVREVLYLKADEVTAAHFAERGLPRFEYVKDGKVMTMAFYQAPAEVLEDPDEAVVWGRYAIEAALRSEQGRRR
ncbi:MAG: TfoX/Sxy family protein [Pseudomonadota bacterium]